ncbi:hypothetical protein RYJ27_08355 [Microbacterium limosum]|uniref:Signal transduction histidine kinase n=1 Tax=Microbacterium limosum TaxID=3079935 RepID=A0AAU0MF00_9MICO|nr:hypothetical protein [Microbacterium sp. Y20]WOQ68726.1 hypothetical protein RYJ27_08355 [Microbacterium sp. Y20]
MSDRVDVSAMLRLTEWPAYVVFAVFTATNAFNTFATLDEVGSPAIAVLALACVTIAGLILLLPAPDPYPLRLTLLVLALTTTAALTTWNIPPGSTPGWSAWFWGASGLVLLMVALRGRIILAWTGFTVMVGVAVWWELAAGLSALDGIMFVTRHGAMLLVGTFFALYLRGAASQIRRLQEAEVMRSREQEAARAAMAEQRARVERLRTFTDPALRLLASDAALTDADREEFRLLEATLRDWLRADGLATEPILTAARDARSRGVDVTLLDDRGESGMDAAARALLDATVSRALRAQRDGDVVVRVLPSGRGMLATIRGETATGPVRVDIAAPTAPDRLDPSLQSGPIEQKGST